MSVILPSGAAVLVFLASLGIAHTNAGAQQLQRWRLVELWRRGGTAEGPYFFDKNGGLKSTPDRGLIVFDRSSTRFHVFDSSGAVLHSFGRLGKGPGEYARSIGGFAVANDGRLLVSDHNNGRIAIVTLTGEVVKYVSALRYGPRDFGVDWDGSFDQSGRFYLSIGVRQKGLFARTGPPPGDSTLLTERWDPAFDKADSSAFCGAPPPTRLNPQQWYIRTEMVNGVPRGSSTWSVPFTDQRAPYVRDAAGFEWSELAAGIGTLVKRQSGQCSRILSRVQLAGARTTVPDSLYRVRRDGAWPEMRDRIPRSYPWYHSLYVDDINRLWVERETAGGRRFDVFASTGRPVAEVEVPASVARDLPLVVTRDRIYGFVRDADDLVYLVSWRIVNP